MILPKGAFRRFHRDARLFLVTTSSPGAALSLYWIDFNLYLASLGYSTRRSASSRPSRRSPARWWPSRRARRRTDSGAGVIFAGVSRSGCVALVGLLVTEVPALIAVFAARWSMGWQAFQVVRRPT